jgi:hypothetical protein
VLRQQAMQRGPLLQLLATVAACGGLPLACSNACTGVDCGLGAHCNADKAAAAAAAAATPQHNDGQTYFCVCQGDYNGSAVRGGPATCTLPPRECCFLLCHCWVDLDWRLHITSGFRLMLMVPVACGIALSCYNMAMHARAYLAMDSGLLLTHGQGDAQDQKATLYRQMRLSFILVLTAAPVLGLVAWCQLYIGGFHAEADAIVMVYEAVAINCFLQMVISFSGGRDAVAQVCRFWCVAAGQPATSICCAILDDSNDLTFAWILHAGVGGTGHAHIVDDSDQRARRHGQALRAQMHSMLHAL